VTRIVLVHGSVTNGDAAWRAQQPLRERWELVVLNRPGFPPGPPVARVDFAEDAEWLRPQLRTGDHLVAHSYGAVVSMLAAPGLELASLTLVEPPATAVARDVPAVRAFEEKAAEWYRDGPPDPREFLAGFLARVGSSTELPDPLSPALEQGARALRVERGPWEADPPLAELRAARYPKLVVSGRHSAAFDAICDVLERELEAERAVLPGAGHTVQRAPGFNERLEAFLASASRGAARGA
jgi:pimeloyl-ACP methyl ester carboxylesterase